MKRNVEIIEEENTIFLEDEYANVTFEIDPIKKALHVRMSVKGDVFYHYSTSEYKITNDPVELHMRLLEDWSEPPRQYSVKDNVVLETEIRKDGGTLDMDERIEELKKEVEWHKLDLSNNFQINYFILSRHPEIIPETDYRKFLRQTVERIKIGVRKIEELVQNDPTGLIVFSGKFGKQLWYPEDKISISENHWDLSEEEREKTDYGQKSKYVHELNDSLFEPNSSKFIGVTKQEFSTAEEIISYIEALLENKKRISPQDTTETQSNDHRVRNWWIVIILTVIALSWGIWTAIGAFVLGVIVMNLNKF